MDSTTIIFKRYEEGTSYKEKLNLPSKWNTYNKFKSGEQWATPTKRTATMPRPVFNFIDQVINHKVASIQNENIKMVFSDSEGVDPQGIEYADIFSKYSETTWESLKQDQLNQEALENSATLGLGIWHYYYDTNKIGGRELEYIGEIKGEVLDPMNIVFGNPNTNKIDEQPYIIARKRGLVSEAKEIARASQVPEGKISLILPDKDTKESSYDKASIEVEGTEKINIYTMYYKKKNEEGETRIFYTKATKGVVIVPETDTGIEVYPIAIMNWYKEKESIFGRGETEGLIPNQKLINFLIALESYNHQLTGFPKMIFKNGAINPNKITNQIGEIIEDMSAGNGFNVSYLNPPQIGSKAQNLAEIVLQLTKDLKGATESNTGEGMGSQLNATAIMLLQKASGIPIEAIKKRFYQAIEDIGRIWEQMWKVKFDTSRIISIKDNDNNDMPTEFRGTDAKEFDMKLKIDIGQASSYTESFTLTALDKFLASGYISFEQYLKYVPSTVVPFKNQLLKEMQELKMQQQAQLEQDVINSLNPAELEILKNSPPEVQQQMIQELMLEMQQVQAVEPNGTSNPLATGQAINPSKMMQGNNQTI